MSRRFSVLTALIAFSSLFHNRVYGQDQIGVNICEDNRCFCDTELNPIEISCDEMGLKSFWELEDWNATFRALNLTGNEPLSVTFIGNDIEHVPIFPPLNITTLYLQKNKIKSIETSAFSHLLGLESINLAHNSLTVESLTEGIFFGQFKNGSSGYFPMPLKHLNLSYNNIHR
jgi:hypothetical protein